MRKSHERPLSSFPPLPSPSSSLEDIMEYLLGSLPLPLPLPLSLPQLGLACLSSLFFWDGRKEEDCTYYMHVTTTVVPSLASAIDELELFWVLTSFSSSSFKM